MVRMPEIDWKAEFRKIEREHSGLPPEPSRDVDWKSELRKIEREYDGLPPEPSPAEIRAREAATRRARAHGEQRMVVLGAGARLLLVALLCGALWWWPYATNCGFGLAFFLGALCMVVVGGLWAAVFSWRHRLPESHTIALLFVLTGLVLVAAQVLPRFGYVTVAGMPAAHWHCVAAPR